MSCSRTFELFALLCVGSLAIAEATESFQARLSPVPMDVTMRATVAGHGSASARLAGSKLEITGSFEGLLSPATMAQVHMSRVTGVHGRALFDLTISKATAGEISGSFEVSPLEIENLRKGRLYLQIDSEKAPEGNLWGWLLPAETRFQPAKAN